MPVSQRISSQSIGGFLEGFVGIDLPFATVEESLRMTRVDFRVTDAPSGGTVTAMVNTAAGGGGSDLIQGTILDGTRHISVTGDVAITGATTLYLRVVSESGAALGLSASVELSTAAGAAVTVYLSTLENVKASLGITDGTNDSILTRHLEGVSKAMQNWMARDILETTYTDEHHYPTGLNSVLYPNHFPITTLSEIRKGGAAIDASGYRLEGTQGVRRISGTTPLSWEEGQDIALDYTAGWASVPADLVDACTQETARRWLQTLAGHGPGAHVSAQTPETGNTKTYIIDGFLPQTLETMRAYRRL